MTGQVDAHYTTRQAAYDLRKLRGKQLVIKPGRCRRYQVPPDAARTITALTVLREQVIAPILAGVRSPRQGRKPAAWTRIDRDYETRASTCTPSSMTSASLPRLDNLLSIPRCKPLTVRRPPGNAITGRQFRDGRAPLRPGGPGQL